MEYLGLLDPGTASPLGVDALTYQLCAILESMSEKDKDRLVYNGRDPAARALADWWSHHQKADAARLEREEREAELIATRKEAMGKLSAKEKKALGLK